MRAWAVPLILLATALAGCSDDGGDADMHDGHDGHGALDGEGYAPDAPPADAPVWSLGDYWTFEDNLGNVYSLVVAEDAGGDWVVLTNDKTLARFDALFDISYVGNVRKADLAGQQGSERIQFFDFPLHHNKEWMTVWDGESRHVVAHALPGGKFHIVAHVAGNEQGDQHATYVYDANIGHFESISFFDANGTATYTAERTGAGADFTGTLYRFGAVEEVHARQVGGPGQAQDQFTVPEGTGELTLTATVDCGGQPAPIFYAVQQPNEDGTAAQTPPTPVVNTVEPVMGTDAQCPDSEGTAQAVVEDPRAGAWRFDAASGSPEGNLDFTAVWQPREDLPR